MGNFVYTEYHLSLICAFASSFRQKVFKEAPAAALTVGKPDFCFNKSYHELCLLNTWSAAPGSAEENGPNTELTYVKRSWEEIRREGFFPPFFFRKKLLLPRLVEIQCTFLPIPLKGSLYSFK